MTEPPLEPGPHERPDNPAFFLKLAAAMILLAVLAYVLLSTFDYMETGNEVLDAVVAGVYLGLQGLLLLSVLLALFFVFCFTAPQVGAAVRAHAQYAREAWTKPVFHMHVLPFRSESGVDEKRFNSRRKALRRARKEATRNTPPDPSSQGTDRA